MGTIIIVGIGLLLTILTITALAAMAKTGGMLREHEGAYLDAKATRADLDAARAGLETLRKDAAETAKILRDEILKTRDGFNAKLEETARKFDLTSERDVDGLRNYARAIDAALTDRSQELAALMQEVRTLRARFKRGVGIRVGRIEDGERWTICITNKLYFEDKNGDVKPERDEEKEEGGQE